MMKMAWKNKPYGYNTKPGYGPDKVSLKERKCLLCLRPFQSWGAGNRVCTRCRDTVDYQDLQYAEPYKKR
jgi:hypothetical protein